MTKQNKNDIPKYVLEGNQNIPEDLKKVKEELVLKEKGFDIFSSTESPPSYSN